MGRKYKGLDKPGDFALLDSFHLMIIAQDRREQSRNKTFFTQGKQNLPELIELPKVSLPLPWSRDAAPGVRGCVCVCVQLPMPGHQPRVSWEAFLLH